MSDQWFMIFRQSMIVVYSPLEKWRCFFCETIIWETFDVL